MYTQVHKLLYNNIAHRMFERTSVCSCDLKIHSCDLYPRARGGGDDK